MGVSIDSPRESGPELTAAELIDFVRNPNKYQALIDCLKSEQDRLDERIAIVGPANEIASLNAHARRLRDEASAELDAAKAVREKAEIALQAAQELSAEADRRLADVMAQETALKAREDAAAAAIAAGNAAKAAFEDKLARLNAGLAALRAS